MKFTASLHMFLTMTATVLLPGCMGPCTALSELGEEPSGEAPVAERNGLSDLARVDLGELDSDMLREKFTGKKWKLIDCDEEVDVMTAFETSCNFRRGDTWAHVALNESEEKEELELAVEVAVATRRAFIQSEGKVLTVKVAAPKLAKKLLVALVGDKIPSARQMTKTLKQMGWQASCEREMSEDDDQLDCTLLNGNLYGELHLMSEDGEEFDDNEIDEEEGMALLGKGHIMATLGIADVAAARELIDDLFAESKTTAGQMLVMVSINDEKSNGKDWDALAGDPDPFVIVDGKSYRDQRCQDEYECLFVVDTAERTKIEVWDADAASDDFAGSTRRCTTGLCEIRDAEVMVLAHW